jgi:NADH-quinone oxidoreductase subunit G
MPDVALTIDGVPVSAPAGTNLVDAARAVDISIPVFCYHPRLEPVGMCRMCLVQVGNPKLDPQTRQPLVGEDGNPIIQMMPKLQPACTTPVSPGMVVLTTTPEVAEAQRGVLEFLLTSHPLDCPVCDKGGECPLQNLTMGWGPGESRFDYDDKAHFEKPVALGDLIYLDRERCILCARCVRFQDEVADDPVLGFDQRGRNWMIISKSDPPFDSKFSGNTTDICPVGALTSSDFRFKARVWELQSKPAVCTLCPVGCNISFDMRMGQLMRVMPRENAAVNDIWICDKGRYGHRFLESEQRLTTPLVRVDGALQPASWEDAMQLVAEKFVAIQSSAGGSAIGGLAGPDLSNEDLFIFQRFFREMLGSDNLDHRIGAPGEPDLDEAGALAGVGVGTNLMECGAGTTALVIGADPEEEAPVYMLRLREIARKGGQLIVAGLRPTKLERSAGAAVRYRAGSDALFVRGLLKLVHEAVGKERVPMRVNGTTELRKTLQALDLAEVVETTGVSEAQLRATAQALLDAEQALVVYGAEARSAGTALVNDLATLALLLGQAGKPNGGLIALLPGGNSRGALDMGVRPDARPGYAPLAKPGRSAREMWEALQAGRMRGLYIAGLDPAAALSAARNALQAAEFVVVQDLFLTETAQLADVVLPAAAAAEYEGTYTNAERRVQRSREARTPAGSARAGWAVVQEVAQTMLELRLVPVRSRQAVPDGADDADARSVAVEAAWDYLSAADVRAEIAERVPGYAGVTSAALTATGKPGAWGRQVNEAVYYDGTNYENTEGVGLQYPGVIERGKGELSVAPRKLPVRASADDRGLLLLEQALAYDGDARLRDTKLAPHVPAPYVGLSRMDAEKLNIKPGDRVQLHSSAGELTLAARVFSDLPAGIALVPANMPATGIAAIQTGPRTRVSVSKVVV